ncbi:hypothetical protein ACVW16_004630 [Bradyrhizobium sp. USDA 4474]
MAEGIVDRLQPVDVEHDQRAAGAVAPHVGDGALELALKAAPVGNIEQEVGVGRSFEFGDAAQRLRQLDPQAADGRLADVRAGCGRARRRGGPGPLGSSFGSGPAGFPALFGLRSGRPFWFLHGLPAQ